MPGMFLRIGCLLLVLGLCSCGKDQSPATSDTGQSDAPKPPPVPQAAPPKAPLIGQPTGSGYADDKIRVQIGPEESLREQQSPLKGEQFLFVRIPVNGSATLVPKDYRIVIAGKQYTPHAVGFGRPSGVYNSAESFVGERVDLVPGASDRILHDGQKIQKCELANPTVFLVYDAPKAASPTLWHGNRSFPLSPNYEALAADLSGMGGTLTSKTSITNPNPNAASSEFSAELIKSSRTRVEIIGSPVEAVVVTVGLTAPKPITIELKRSDIALKGGAGTSGHGTVYFHFDDVSPMKMAGSTIVEGERYEDQELIGLDSGGFRVDLAPGKTTSVLMIFPNPPAGDLDLTLSPAVAVAVPEPVNPLGKFRPPLDKLPGMVAWAQIIGPPTDAGFLSDRAAIAASAKQIDAATPTSPPDGQRFLVVRFRMEQDALFVPVDYRIADRESNTIYRPFAVAFGDSPTFVKGLDYEKIPLTLGNATAPKLQASRPAGWTLKTPEVSLLYEVAPAQEYVFLHGNTQFVVEP